MYIQSDINWAPPPKIIRGDLTDLVDNQRPTLNSRFPDLSRGLSLPLHWDHAFSFYQFTRSCSPAPAPHLLKNLTLPSTPVYPRAHSHMHTHTHLHTHMCTLTTHTYRYAHSHMCTLTHTLAHTCVHTHSCTLTHAHTHSQSPQSLSLSSLMGTFSHVLPL